MINRTRKVPVALLILSALCVFLVSCPAGRWQSGHISRSHWKRCDPLKQSEQMIALPGFKRAYHVVPDCNAFSSERVSVALVFFIARWREYFGDPGNIVKDNLDHMMIMWSREKRYNSGYNMDGIYFKDWQVHGMAQLKDLVWVSLRKPGSRICDTSLVHELVHASIWALKETDGDPDHLGPVYQGWTRFHTRFIDDVNKELCDIGL